jgi:TetR/AcrR family transcriptional regulator
MAKTAKETILKAAKDLFVAKGYEGTSISAIAKKAGIPQSLIYHYFSDKQSLWKEVKSFLLEKIYQKEFVTIDPEGNLDQFIHIAVKERFHLFLKSPEIVRMLLWQSLETNETLYGGSSFASTNWIHTIKSLQKRGEIKKEMNPKFIILMIRSLVLGAFFQEVNEFKEEKIETYIDAMCDYLKSYLTTS